MSEENLYNPATRWTDRQRLEPEEPEAAIFFTLLRQQGVTAEQIAFQLKSGCQHTLPITEITEMYFAPERGIILFFRSGLVRIEGRNLEKLHQYLQARKVIEIREFSESGSVFFDKEALFISGIGFESDNLLRLGV